MKTCIKCGAEISEEFAFCQNCGASLTAEPSDIPAAEPVAPLTAEPSDIPAAEPVAEPAKASKKKGKTPKEKKKCSKKGLVFAIIGAVVVLAALIVAAILIFGGKTNNYALYIKDQEMFFYNMKKNSDPWELTSKLTGDSELSNSQIANAGWTLGYYTYMSENGKYIFFPDKIGEDDFALYYKKVAKPDSDAVKIDTGVSTYFVNKAATLVIYLKEGNLYEYNISKDSKDKIASEVSNFVVSEDGKKVAYITEDKDIYLKYSGKDKEKIASEVDTIQFVNKAVTTAYYIKDGTLYKQVEGQDRVKIDTDIRSVIEVYESGEIYYTKENDPVLLKDYVIDDKKAADEAMVAPTRPTAPSYYYYDSYDEYLAAYDQYLVAVQQYEKDYALYQEKLSRDRIRSSLESATAYYYSYSLFYYNGTETKEITDASNSGSSYTRADNAAVISYEAYNQSEITKVKLSEVSSIYDVRDMVHAAMFSSSTKYIAVKGNAAAMKEEDDITRIYINDAGTLVYYIDNVSENEGDLYKLAIQNGKIGEAEKYDSMVNTSGVGFLDDDNFMYVKDYKNETGDLYINKKKVDSDVRYSSAQMIQGKVYYYIDYNSDKGYGTLKVYANGKTDVIAHDVWDYDVAVDGQVLYLTDYNTSNYEGELYAWDDGDKRKVDNDVTCIIHRVDGQYRG